MKCVADKDDAGLGWAVEEHASLATIVARVRGVGQWSVVCEGGLTCGRQRMPGKSRGR